MTASTAKKLVKQICPTAFCCKLGDGSGYIVWPQSGPGPRGAERAAIGMHTTIAGAWTEAYINLTTTKTEPCSTSSQTTP